MTQTTPPRAVVNPLVDIRSPLLDEGNIELYRITADGAAYWRLTTVPEFDGRSFKLPNGTLTDLEEVEEPGVGSPTIRQQIQILGLGGEMLPTAADPLQVAPNAEIRLDRDTGTLVKTSPLVPGEQYTIVSVAADVSPDALRVASSDNPPDEVFLGLPDSLPDLISELAGEVTAGATTDYDRMISLQNWFRTFHYSTEVRPGHSSDAIANFLQTRIGFCEQFAAAFAVMTRTLGIPSRVAVGYTPGRLDADGSYSVLGRNSHAWPEVWFDGIGWVPFEPTPQRGIPGAENYTGVEPAQQVNP